MNSIRCSNCGLTNFATEEQCKRCGGFLGFNDAPVAKETSGMPVRFSLAKLIVIPALAFGGYYIYANYLSSPTPPMPQMQNASTISDIKPTQQTLSDIDRQKSQRIANAVGVAPGLNAHDQRTKETDRIMNSVSNTAAKP